MTVNKERVALWVESLERQPDGQGRNALEEVGTGRQCCLGRGCRVAMANGLEVQVTEVPGGRVMFDDMTTAFPQSVTEWYGFDRDDPWDDPCGA